MISLVLVTVLLFGAAVQGETESSTAIPYQDAEWVSYGLTGRIVNGTKAALRQFPYQVSLRRSYNAAHFCGGSLISEYHVLTAAHCMFLSGSMIQPWTIMVVAGQLLLNEQSSTGQRRGVEKIDVHSEFDKDTLQNDVALLTLKVPFKLTPEVNVVPLTSGTPEPNTVCQVAGWGYPSEDDQTVSNRLMYVDLPIINLGICKKLLSYVTDVFPGMMCAGYMEGQKDACGGDSGGGMLCNGILAGVVSGGDGCARPRVPGVYSDVHFFQNWIEEHMETPVVLGRISSGGEKMLNTSLLPFIVFSKMLLKRL
ncbi:trypsin isoform X1 [Megachile rotundata]|uniref:trypsin isoform X1 n=1 Tax=Megachile rotundata TaxID=143995 RepID=UPI003FD60E3C